MNDDIFRAQIARLSETYGPRNYPKERVQLIWHAVKSLPDSFMEPTVNYFIGNLRVAPNVKEFHEKAEEFRGRDKDRRLTGTGGSFQDSFRDVLNHVASYKGADREFVRKCGEHLKSFTTKKLTKAQFLEGCAFLDQAAALYVRKEKQCS